MTSPICPACAEPLDATLAGKGYALHATCDPLPVTVDAVAVEALALVKASAARAPRSVQRIPGPSELGMKCDRRLTFRIGGVDPVNVSEPSWPSIIGTGTHEVIANAIAAAEINRFDFPGAGPRWHVEERVTVGTVGGVPITGNADLYDGHTGTVLDWKIVGGSTAATKAANPPAQYVSQAHLYGQGFVNAGHPVNSVGIVFIGRDGGEPHVWSAPFDPAIAAAALDRANGIALSVDALGVEFTAAAMSTTADYCRTCPYFQAGSTNPRACAGASSHAEPQSLTQLLS